MHNHWLFTYNVLAHLVASMSSLVSFGISIYEATRKKKFETWAFFAIGALCLMVAFDQAWQDEHRNAEILISEKSSAIQERDFWKTQSYEKDESLRKREDLLGQNYGVLANTQMSLAALSNKLLDNLRSTPLKMNAFWVSWGLRLTKPGQADLHEGLIIAETSKSIASINLDLHCDNPFKFAGRAWLVSDLGFTSQSHQTGDNDARIVLSNGPWNPGTPLVVLVASSKEELKCEVKNH
jgi:hypothetical protein